jgi:hypothetical protein
MKHTDRTDQELTELAAKSCGLAIDKYGAFTVEIGDDGYFDFIPWEPLLCNKTAFELACKLGLKVEFPKYKGFGSTCGKHTVFRDEPEEQTRRAIVLEAADKAYIGDSE